jgi:hypothetical protein
MKKILLPMAAIFFGTIMHGQVGINTSTPKATFDIMAKNSSGTSTLTDGLLIPRVDRQRAVNMTSVEPSTLIYVNSIATGSATGQGSNIDSIGFYYFDETTSKWSKLITPVGDPTPDAFVDDSANAMVKLGATSSGSARAAGSEFVIMDAGNVGIGTSTPTQKLDVRGNGKFESTLAQIEVTSTGVNPANISLTRNNGNTNIPVGELLGFFNFGGYAGGANNVMSAITADKRNAPDNLGSGLNFYTNGTTAGPKMSLNEFGNLGVGTSTPAQKLEVNGNVKFNAVPNASSVDNTDRIMVLQSDGTGKKVPLTSLQPPNTYTPRGIFRYQAPNPALYALNTSYPTTTIINNIDIGYNTFTVYIPANTSSLILFNYSIPNGLTDSTGDGLSVNTSGTVYQGIRFLKAGVEEPSGSRKFRQTGVSCVAGIYSETIDNPTSSQIAIVFSLHGYLEIRADTNFPSGSFARFNMNKAVGENYNWRKGILTLQQFDKPL